MTRHRGRLPYDGPIHLLDEADKFYGTTYCRSPEDTGVGLYDRLGEHPDLTDRPCDATCSKCIEAYETAPQPATTKDLLDVLDAARALARVLATDEPTCKLEQRLKRPRPITKDRWRR